MGERGTLYVCVVCDMSVWYPTNSGSNLKYEQCQRAQSFVAKEDDVSIVRHSATKEMAICRREN